MNGFARIARLAAPLLALIVLRATGYA